MGAWGFVFVIVLYCVTLCRASFIYANNELYNFQKLDTTSSPAKVTNYSQSLPVNPTWIGSDSLQIYICTTTNFYTVSLATELVTAVSTSTPAVSQYFRDSPANSDSVYYFTLKLASPKSTLSISKKTGYITQGYSWTFNSASVSIALYSLNKTIYVLFTSSWNIYTLPYDNNDVPGATVATNVQGNITNPTFPIMVDSTTDTMLWGGQTTSGYVLYGMNITDSNVTFVVYELNTTSSKLIISYANGGFVYGLQLDGNNTDGWLWQCQIRNCTPQMLFSVPSPAMLPFKYIESALKLLYTTTVRNAVVSLSYGKLHSILSPRRIAAFAYNALQDQYMYVTDTGSVEVTSPGGKTNFIPPLASRPINSNTSQFYFDQDISNYSISYDQNFGDIYVSTGGTFWRYNLPTDQVNTPVLQNLTSPFALYVAQSDQLVFACDRSDKTIKVAINRDDNATSLTFTTLTNYSSPPVAIYYDPNTKLVYAVNDEGLYANVANLSSMGAIMTFPRAYQPYAITTLHSNSSEYYFLAADPTCTNSSCLSIQKCNTSSPCNPTIVASLSLPSSLPEKSALLYLAATDTLLVLVNFATPLIKISGISGPNPLESVFCTLTDAVSGSVAVTSSNSVLIPSKNGIMEYNSTGMLLSIYNDSTLNLGPSPVFAIDPSNGKFYYVDVVAKSILQSESYQTTSSVVTVHQFKESSVISLAVSAGVIYYQSGEGSIIQVLGKSTSTVIESSSVVPLPISYSFYAIGETLLVSNSSAMDISETTKGKSVHLYSASVSPSGLAVSDHMVYWMSTGTFSVNSWNSSDPSAFVEPFSLNAIGAEIVGLTFIPDPPKGNNSNFHHYRTFIIVISAVGAAVLAFILIFCIVRYRTRRNAYSVIEDSHMTPVTTPPSSPVKPTFSPPSVYASSKETEANPAPVYQSFSQTHSGSSSPTSPSELTCSICEDRPKDTALSCGHVICTFCAAQVKLCPFCKEPIKARSKIYI